MDPALLVLGMHRSGTSAMAGLLHLLGVELGPDLLPPNPYNPTGHWEHAGIVAIHDRLLAALGSGWDDVCPLADGWWAKNDVVAPLHAALLAVVRRDFDQRPLWGLKDPRLCRLLPLWNRILAELGRRPCFVVMVRSPVEVAASLRRRDGFVPAYSHLLWTEHLLGAERHSRAAPRVFVDYDELLRDWRAVARRLAAVFELSWPTPPERAGADADRFVSAALRHHRRADETGSAPAWAEDLHAALQAAAHGDDRAVAQRAAAVDAELAPLRPLLCPAVAELRQRLVTRDARVTALTAEVERLAREAAERDGRLAHLEEERLVHARHLAALEQHLREREGDLVRLEQENAGRAEAVRTLATEQADLVRALADVRAEADELRHTRAALEGSAVGRLALRRLPGVTRGPGSGAGRST